MAGKQKDFTVALSTISGSAFPNILKVFKNMNIDKPFIGRKWSAYGVSAVAEPFRWWENIRYNGAINKTTLPDSPVFILGHWRSGTTLLHNTICQDPQFAFVTTYQGVFPNQLLGSKWLFRNIMQFLMPDKRPSDNVKLSPEFPQEEEFALGNVNPYSFYNFWYFPNEVFKLYEKYIRFNGVVNDVRERFKEDYKHLVKKSMYYHGRQQFVSKNPPHTGRIKILLEAFPNAKFIYIYRNPITIFESTRKLLVNTIPPLHFQNIPEGWFESTIFQLYKNIIQDYEATKHLIPKGNLIEIKFEDFEKDILGSMHNIYSELNLNGYSNAESYFKNYINSQKQYTKNKYQFSKEKVAQIKQEWDFSMQQYGYDIPEGMELI